MDLTLTSASSAAYVDETFRNPSDIDGLASSVANHTNMNEDEQSLDTEGYQPTYAEAFPPLPSAGNEGTSKGAKAWGEFHSRPANVHQPTKSIQSSYVTQVFRVPFEERRYKNLQNFGGDCDRQNEAIRDVMLKTGTAIEVSVARDQSLTVMVSGKKESCAQARRLVMNQLQTQASIEMQIPRDHHRFILGRSGKKLQELELATATKITITRDSDLIRIVGTKEGIDRARHEIQLVSDEQAKLAFERLNIPKIFHPFICGPNNAIAKDIANRTGARINIPPPSVPKDELTVAGEKEGVQLAVDMINQIYEEKNRKCNTVSVEVRKSQHKYIIGPRGQGIQEILAATGVSVEMPPPDSSQETITLRGEPDKLGMALTQVYEKANSVVISEVVAPKWLHRFIIGKEGQNIKKITEDLQKVHIEFFKDKDKIVLEGPPSEVEAAQQALVASIRDLKNTMDFAEIEIDLKWHRYIIGKNGANVNRIKAETGTSINIPPDSEKSNIIRIEGSPDGVTAAKFELLQMASKMENEKSRDIIIEQRFHRNIIGSKGEKIREIREKFNDVQISVPDSDKKSDVVTIRGPKADVDKCYAHLKKMAAELVAANYRLEVPVFKKFHRNVIGKGGNTIRKIKEETNTNIEIPTENSNSEAIVITGYKERVEAARDKILAIQNELANVTSAEITIPHKLHTSLIGAKGRLIRSIMEESGDVQVHFPPEGSNSDKVSIRGPKEDVQKVKEQLMDLANERLVNSFSVEIRAKPEHHRFLIGRGGANIREIRESTGVRVMFPGPKDASQDIITIIGKEDAVAVAKADLEQKIKDLDLVAEGHVEVDPKYHRHFIARRAQVLRELAEEYGGVLISFPRSDSQSSRVVVKGAKDCVEAAKKRILEIVQELDSLITIECVIAQKHHRSIMGVKGQNVHEITVRNNVQIKFPERPVANGNHEDEKPEEAKVNGDEGHRKTDIILITGKKEQCEAAKEDLLTLVPISEALTIPFEHHRYIIGTKGAGVRKLMDEFDVNINIPPAKDESDQVIITGPAKRVTLAIEGLKKRVTEIESENEDRKLRSHHLILEVPAQYHPKIIGYKGQVVNKLRSEHDVQIQVPPPDSDPDSAEANQIILTGYEVNCESAKKAILQMVSELEQQVTIEVDIDPRIHSRIIGQRGRSVRKIMDNFGVDIRFPRNPNVNIISITGMEDAVEDCKEHLLTLEEEYLEDVRERYEEQGTIAQYMNPPSKSADSNHGGFVVRDAPWSTGGGPPPEQGSDKQPMPSPQTVPDANDSDAFPSLGAAASQSQSKQPAWGAWGGRQ